MAAIDADKLVATRAAARNRKAVVYPTGDGKPLGEDESHVRETLNCIQFLQFWYRNRPDVYVIGNNFVYWNEGFPRDRVSPDCYVVFGVEKRIRPSYKSWFYDPATGEFIPTLAESADKTLSAHRQSEEAQLRASELEAENARLRAEMDALRRELRGDS